MPHITGPEIVIGVIVIVVFLSLVAAPVLGEIIGGVAGAGAHKAAPWVFFFGLGVLGIGIGFSVTILIIVGSSMVGSVLLGIIVMNYLTYARASQHLALALAAAARRRAKGVDGEHGRGERRGGGRPRAQGPRS
ncbi:MAG TPA: hypothetical protein VGI58_10110 [Streptosporangiaceae bacterium]